MRIPAGTTLNEAYENLSTKQKDRIARALAFREEEPQKVREAEQKVKAILQRSRDEVRKALEEGVPASILSHRLNLSPARIYQMRDEAIKFNESKKSKR